MACVTHPFLLVYLLLFWGGAAGDNLLTFVKEQGFLTLLKDYWWVSVNLIGFAG